MIFLIQFIRFRRGVREVIRTLSVEAADGHAALARVRSRVGTSTWPMNTDALRVMDDGGRTVLDWTVAAPAVQQPPSSRQTTQRAQIAGDPLPASQPLPDSLTEAVGSPTTGHPHLEVGQAISFAEDGKSESWKGSYQIVNASDSTAGEAQYTIRSADETHDRVVKEHELREDLGARTRGQ
jgi:hypothetical protein